MNPPSTLQPALIPTLPNSAYYIPNFITPEEEAHLLQKINAVPLPTWKQLTHRRLQAHPSPLSASNTLLSAPLPTWLWEPIVPRFLSLHLSPKTAENIFSASPHGQPNHCLVNEYLPGQGIHAHEDGTAYFPVVATVTLGSHCVLNVRQKDASGQWRILQEPRSLLITTGEVYTGCLHGIEGIEVDEDLRGVANWELLGDEVLGKRETRVSLTFRDVLKVKNLGKAFGGFGKERG